MSHPKTAVLIASIPRSGTSAFAGLFEILGYSVGQSIRPADIVDNPRGYYENSTIVEFNQGIMRSVGLTWSSPFINSAYIFDQINITELKEKLKAIISIEYRDDNHIVIKDPRLSFLLPIYQSVLKSLGYDIKVIIPVRNPTAVANSLRKSSNLRKVRSYLLYIQYYSQLETLSRSEDRAVVLFEDLIDNPKDYLSTILNHFKLPAITAQQGATIDQFIDTNKYQNADNSLDENCPDSTKRVYDLLSKLSGEGNQSKPLQKKFNKITSEILEWNSIAFQSMQGKFAPEGESPFFGQLFIDSGQGMTEENSLKQVVIGHESKLEFNLENIENIQGLRFDPINDYCIMRIHSMDLYFIDGSKQPLSYSGNYSADYRPLLVFNVADPNIDISLPESDSQIKSLLIKLEYIAINKTSIEVLLQKMESNVRLKDEVDKLRLNLAQAQSIIDLPETAEVDEVIQESYALKSEIADLKDQLSKHITDQSGKDIHSIKAELSQVKSINDSLKDQLQAANTSLQALKDDEAITSKQLEEFKTLVEQKQKALAELEAIKTEQEGRLAELKTSQEKLFELSKGSERLIEKYSAQKNDAVSKMKTLEAQLEDTSYRLEEKNGELSLIRDHVVQLQNERGNSDHIVEQRLQQIKDLESHIHDKQVHINNIEGFLNQKDRTLAQIAGSAVNNTSSLKVIQEHTNALKDSLSYKLGFGLTAPVRFLVNKLNGAGSTTNPVINEILSRKVDDLNIPEVDLQIAPVEKQPSLVPETPNEVQGLVKLEAQYKKDLVRGTVEPTRPVVLFLSPHLPDYDTSSGGRRATLMLQLMAEEFDVYVYTLGDKQKKYIDKLNSIGVTVLKGPHLSEIDIHTYQYPEVPLQLPRVDAIIYAWYTTYFQSKYLMTLYPKATAIFDSVDVHWIREERLLGIDKSLTREGVEQNMLNEVHAYNQGKIIWAVTEEDKQNIIEEIPSADVRVVSNVHDIAVTEYVDRGQNTMLFFGGFKHTPNISAAKKLCEELLPQIRKHVPDATVVLAGSHASEEIRDLGKLPGVDFRGFIEDEDLHKLYEDCAVTVVPLLAGAGIKGKICEAIAHKLPVITNSIGNEGIELQNEVDGLVTDDYDEMVTLTVNALKRNYDFDEMTEKAQQKLLALVGPEEVKRQMVDSVAPMVSICIVTWNRLGLMQRCIESIQRNTKYPRYRVLAYSNGCTDGTQEYLQEVAESDPRIIPMLSEMNEVFVIPNNKMMLAYPEDDVVLVNNDTYLNEGWLEELQKTAYCRKNTGIVGSKILYPDGTLQEFGSELYNNYSGNNIGKHQNPLNPEYQSIQEVGYVSGCSMYITRHTLNHIGVFDMQFHPCYCEDSDLSYSAWEQGIETVVTPYSTIYHDEGGTSGTSTESGFKAFQDVNFHKFYLKHRGKINRINWNLDQITNEKIEQELKTQFRSQDGRLILNGTQLAFPYSTQYQSNHIRSYREYKKYTYKMNSIYNKRFILEKNIVGNQSSAFTISGYNQIAQAITTYHISENRDHIHRGVGMPNLREELYCPETKTNSRIRALIMQYLKETETHDSEINVLCNSIGDGISDYLHKEARAQVTNCEWIDEKDDTKDCNYIDPSDTGLQSQHYDVIIEAEQLHLVPDHMASLTESARLLKPGGKLIISVPFLNGQKKTQVRAYDSEDGDRVDILHPITFNHTTKQIPRVCYRLYGWSLFEDIKKAGFSDAYGAFAWSLYHGILGMDILTIVAVK